MITYSSDELQNISAEFRAVARRLSRTDYSQCDANLKRFMSFIDTNPLIKSFIEENNIKQYDIQAILNARDWLDPFEISHITTEEISFEYQLLHFAVKNYEGNFTQLYGTHWYIRTKSTVNDEMHTFIEHIIDPLIDYIAEFIRKKYDFAIQGEVTKDASIPHSLSATNSTIVFNSSVGGDVSTTVTLDDKINHEAQDIIGEITQLLKTNEIDNSSEILEILESINDSLKENEHPKKGFLTALKSLCSSTASVATLAAALIKLFSSS